MRHNIVVCILALLILATYAWPQEKKKLQQGDWIVKVVMKNGTELIGVIRDNRFWEKPSFGIYHKVESSRIPGAGMRLWYVKHSPGFLFIPTKKIARVIKLKPANLEKEREIQRKLSQKRQAILQEIEEKKQRKLRLLEEKKEQQQLEEKKAQAQQLEKQLQELEKMELTEEEQALLKEFPPSGNWGADRLLSIEKQLKRGKTKFVRREITNSDGDTVTVLQKGPPFGGTSPEERKFANNYEAWKTAVNKQKMLRNLPSKKAQLEAMLEELQSQQQEEPQPQKTPSPKTDNTPPPPNNQQSNTAKPKPTIENPPLETSSPTTNQPPFDLRGAIRILLYSNSPQKKIEAAQKIGQMGEKAQQAAPTLHSLVQDRQTPTPVRVAALNAAISIGQPKDKLQSLLAKTTSAQKPILREKSMLALRHFPPNAQVRKALLERLAFENKAPLKYLALRTIQSLKIPNVTEQVRRSLTSPHSEVQVAASATLVTLLQDNSQMPEASKEILVKGVLHPNPEISRLAARAILQWQSPDIAQKLQPVLGQVSHEDIRVKLQRFVSKMEQQKAAAAEKEQDEQEAKEREKQENIFDEGEEDFFSNSR